MNIKVTERTISRLWQSHLVRYPVADTGEWLHIIFPGRASNTSGCDFKDAVFAVNGNIISGNVEVHLKSSQWHSHGHHRDPKYNNIALHVVWQHDTQAPTRLQNGKTVPTICLSSFISSPVDELNNQINSPHNSLNSCPASRHSNTERFSQLLTATGKERFTAKVSLFRKALNIEDAGQVLYRGIARALGYAQNAGACEELAERLPLSIIMEKGKPVAGFVVQVLLLGSAGLLPSQRSTLRQRQAIDRNIHRMERIWQSVGIADAMNEADWCFFRVRPYNFPTRRLIALSYLISRYRKSGLLRGLLQLVNKAPAGNERHWLENSLAVAARGYWESHFDFGIVTKRRSAILGRDRASAIVINTVLPFASAWGELNSHPKLKAKAAEIYRRYPGTGDNELTRYMKQQLGLKPDIHLSACQQQGLIHIFNICCRRRDCTECPVAFTPG